MIEDEVRQATVHWLESAVLGLGLCPFAFKPWREGKVAIEICLTSDETDLLDSIAQQAHLLINGLSESGDGKSQVAALNMPETTLVVTPNLFADFYLYNQFLDEIDRLFKRENLLGLVQVASFHPDYQFADTEPDDKSNLTNRSPYPVFHLIKEQSIEEAIAKYDEPETIPERNISTVESLNDDQLQQIFPFLFPR